MSKSTTSLQAALSQGSGKQPTVQQPQQPASDTTPAVNPRMPPSRVGKENVSAWLHPDYQTSLRMAHAVTGKKKQDLVAEALNDLFAKYDVPQVRED